MPQEWYQTIDDYAIYLLRANVDLAGPGAAAKVARAAALPSGPVAAVYVAANVLALGALVAFDPSGLRERGPSALGTADMITAASIIGPQLQRAYSDLNLASQGAEGIVKDERGVIEIV